MRKYLTFIILSIILISVGWSQCNDNEVELWGECYSIENTDSLDLSNNELTGSIPPEIGNLTNLTYLNLGGNQLTGEIPESICILVENNCIIIISNNQLCPPYPSCISPEVIDTQDTSDCP